MRIILLSFFTLLSFGNIFAQISASPDFLNFFTVYTDSPDSLSFDIVNNSNRPYVVTDIQAFSDGFFARETNFTVPANGSKTVWVICAPNQNVKYVDYLFVKTNSHPEPLQVFLYAFAKHRDPYYDLTQDKWHEDLKAALKSLLNFGTTDFTYNIARDSLFMTVDNQKVNGGGATQNTLECVYTGQQAVGYSNRQDAQTNYNFNTEHTFPQSLFNQNWPMVADLHHLFAVTSSANSERSNKPFGTVSNPSWTAGGSKSNGSTFEPRDAQKGAAARAMFYFVLRYQDFNGFAAPQENILRQWNANFPPNAQEVTRNDLIFRMQSNRNPFVDHPEMLERIASVCTNDPGPQDPAVWISSDTLFFQDVPAGTTVRGEIHLSNQGWSDMTAGNFTLNLQEFAIVGAPPASVKIDSSKTILLDFTPPAANQNYNGTLTFTTDDPGQPNVTVWLQASSISAGIADPFPGEGPALYPNPAEEWVYFNRNDFREEIGIRITDLAGRTVGSYTLNLGEQELPADLSGLQAGIYLVEFSAGEFREFEKIIIR